jgi:phage regulator Rha-like protein
MTNVIAPRMIEGELRILDIELAERLGFARPRVIRELIERHIEALSALGAVCRTVRQTSSDKGGRPATEYYLNRKQAIFVTAKSATTEATEITIEIIERFNAYERGVMPRQIAEAFEVIALQNRIIIEQNERFDRLEKKVDAALLGFDETQKTVKDYYTSFEILRDQNAAKKGRRGLAVRVTSRLRRWCREHNMDDAIKNSKETGRYMFRLDVVRR